MVEANERRIGHSSKSQRQMGLSADDWSCACRPLMVDDRLARIALGCCWAELLRLGSEAQWK